MRAPDTLDKILEHLDRGLALLKERQSRYIDGRAYYEGTRDEVFANAAISAALNAEARAYPLNLAHIPVDALIDKVNLTGIVAAEGNANTKLEQVLENNDVLDEADDWARKAAYFGDYYAIIDVTEIDEATNAATEMVVLGASPLSTIMVYKGKDGRTPIYAVRRWLEGKTPHASVHYDDIDALLIGVDGSDGWESKGYSPDLDDDDEDGESYKVPHPGDCILVVHYPVDGKPYGTPVHRKAWGPQDAITKVSATNLATVDAQGFPTRYALLDPNAAGDDDIDDDFGEDGLPTAPTTTDGQTKPTNGSKLKTGPGLIHMLAGIKEVGQWDAAEATGFLLNLEFYIRAMAVATGTPMFEFDLKGEQPSGEARRRASARLNKHARKIIRQIGKAHETLGDTILAVLGVSNATVTASFQPVETETDKDGLELVGEKVKQGVPLRVALAEAGYSTEQIEEWWPKDAPAIPISAYPLLGKMLTDLGAAITLDVINPKDAAALIPDVITMAVAEGPAIESDLADPAPMDPQDAKAIFDALGAAARAGADMDEAAEFLGVTGVSFPNVPVTVRVPEDTAAALEQQGPGAV